MEALKPLDQLLKPHKVAFGLMSDDYGFGHNIPNAFMASIPGHEFWLTLIKRIMDETVQDSKKQLTPEFHTGPVILKQALDELGEDGRKKAGIYYLEPGIIYPYDWHRPGNNSDFCWAIQDTFNEYKCKEQFPNATTITYWSHSWGWYRDRKIIYQD
jgi:hypothetical protein